MARTTRNREQREIKVFSPSVIFLILASSVVASPAPSAWVFRIKKNQTIQIRATTLIVAGRDMNLIIFFMVIEL